MRPKLSSGAPYCAWRVVAVSSRDDNYVDAVAYMGLADRLKS